MRCTGSYGAVPRCVDEARKDVLAEVDKNPDIWFRVNSESKVLRAIECVSSFIGSSPQDVVFVSNATEAMNAVLSSLEKEGLFSSSSAVLCLDLEYGAVSNALHDVCARRQAGFLELKVPLPTRAEDVVALVESTLRARPDVTVCVFDHITSQSAIVLPAAALCALCKSLGVRTVVDGAHAIGQIQELNIPSLGADYYMSNCHKWLFAPLSCALLYCAPERQRGLRPLCVSHNHYSQDWRARFFMQGTRDLSAYVVVPRALAFVRDELGLERAHIYCTSLLRWAADFLIAEWWGPATSSPTSEPLESSCMEKRAVADARAWREAHCIASDDMSAPFMRVFHSFCCSISLFLSFSLFVSLSPFSVFSFTASTREEKKENRERLGVSLTQLKFC